MLLALVFTKRAIFSANCKSVFKWTPGRAGGFKTYPFASYHECSATLCLGTAGSLRSLKPKTPWEILLLGKIRI